MNKMNKKRQLEGLRAIGSHTPIAASASTSALASASVGCVGEGSFWPRFCPNYNTRASASASASRSYTEIESNLLQPRVRKNRMNSYFVPHTTPDSQPTIEGMGLNEEIHDATKKDICKFLYFCNIPFVGARVSQLLYGGLRRGVYGVLGLWRLLWRTDYKMLMESLNEGPYRRGSTVHQVAIGCPYDGDLEAVRWGGNTMSYGMWSWQPHGDD